MNQLQRQFKLKSVICRIIKFPARVTWSIVQPVAIRVRRYLIEGLRQDILGEIQKASESSTQEIQREILKVSESSTQEIQREILKVSESGTQEIQREIQKASESSTQEIQREILLASTAMLQAIDSQNTLLCPRLDRIEQYAAATARRVAIYCDKGEVMVRTEVGYVLCAASDHALISCLLETGDLEIGTRLLIQRYLKPGDVYVDVGANVGMHTLAAARAMQGRGKIIAFEPYKPTKLMLEKSVWLNGFSNMIEIHQAAVSNIEGQQKLFLGATSGHHSLFALDSSSKSSKKSQDVALVRLDGVITPGQRIDLMKIDAEGAELEVIEGGASLIKCNPDIALIVEFGPSHLRRTGRSTKQWIDMFSALGLDYKVINDQTGVLETWSFEALEQSESVNLFFTRADSAAWNRLS